MPFIEDNPEAIAVYQKDPLLFWRRMFTPSDPFHQLSQLVCDGAHRRYISIAKAIEDMRVKWLSPEISIGEIVSCTCRVQFIPLWCIIFMVFCMMYLYEQCIVYVQSALGHSLNRLTTKGHVRQTEADNMYSLAKLIDNFGYSQVPNLLALHLKSAHV